MSTVALAIGLVVGNILHRAAACADQRPPAEAAAKKAAAARRGTSEFLLGIIPTTLVSALTGGSASCRRCSSRSSSGSRSSAGPRGRAGAARHREHCSAWSSGSSR